MIIRICGVLVLVAALWNFGVAFTGVPAFDEEARQRGALGDWRLPIGAAMYDRGAYLFQLGYGYANLDESMLIATNTALPEGFSSDPEERAELAIALFEESILNDPANAHAWTWLAWSQSTLGEMETARETMAVSWELAPYNRALASTRLDFAALIDEFSEIEGDGTAPLTDAELASVRKDFAVLNLRDEFLREEYLELLPFLAAE